MKPIIGITMQHDLEKDILWSQQSYLDAVSDCGGIPLAIPPVDSIFSSEIIKRADGFIFTGGGDIDPGIYGDPYDRSRLAVSAKRDSFELELFRECVKNDVPTLGICRGIQVMNVAMGGRLVPHTPYHSADYAEGRKNHIISAGKKHYIVNSFHHQVLEYIPPCFKQFAQDLRQDAEGIYMPDKKFIVGVQWHPEKNYKYNSCSRNLIKMLIDSSLSSHTEGRQTEVTPA